MPMMIFVFLRMLPLSMVMSIMDDRIALRDRLHELLPPGWRVPSAPLLVTSAGQLHHRQATSARIAPPDSAPRPTDPQEERAR
jgi:hypothetical protein